MKKANKVLPPNTEGTTYGNLTLEVGSILYLVYGSIDYPRHHCNYLLQFHLRFYGEKENTILR